MKHIQWRNTGNKLSLFIINEQYPNGVIYSNCLTPGIKQPDYRELNGSPGYATMQHCLKLGYTYLPTEKYD